MAAELVGTFWLVLGGCGSAVLAAKFAPGGIGLLGVSLAFGLSLLTMASAFGPVSGCHLNPAVTIGMAISGRCPPARILPYIIAQLLGAILAAWVLSLIAGGAPGFDLKASGFAANGYGTHSPGSYSMQAVVVCEFVMTFMFVTVILAATAPGVPAGLAPIAIGLCLTLIHLVSIPVDNTSVNPARSTGPALFVGGWAIDQLVVFWIAPICGAIAASLFYRIFQTGDAAKQ